MFVLYNPVYGGTPSPASTRADHLRIPLHGASAPALESSPDGPASLRVDIEPGNGRSSQSSDTDSPRYWERRDSGVGSSLSRYPSVAPSP